MATVAALPLAAADAKKPRLDLRASPLHSFSPASIHFTGELVGGDDVPEFHCPELEWNWDDGSKSSQEPDCEPLGPDGRIDRVYSADHSYPRAGTYTIQLSLHRGKALLARQTVKVIVKAGAGDSTWEEE
jgi:PKD repeat protein